MLETTNTISLRSNRIANSQLIIGAVKKRPVNPQQTKRCNNSRSVDRRGNPEVHEGNIKARTSTFLGVNKITYYRPAALVYLSKVTTRSATITKAKKRVEKFLIITPQLRPATPFKIADFSTRRKGFTNTLQSFILFMLPRKLPPTKLMKSSTIRRPIINKWL